MCEIFNQKGEIWMKNKLFLLTLILTFSFNVFTQDANKKFWEVELKANMKTSVSGNINEGYSISDYSWAWRSSNACFPGTQKSKFTGKHTLYVVKLPPRSILTVTVRPKDKSKNLSIYGYQIGEGKKIFPEDLQSCVTCEAEHKWDYPKRGKTQDESRTITFNATTNSYNVIVGVTGADGLGEGEYVLEFTLKQ
jgi:hypothetical protein